MKKVFITLAIIVLVILITGGAYTILNKDGEIGEKKPYASTEGITTACV